MRHKTKKRQMVSVTKSITCDRCGKTTCTRKDVWKTMDAQSPHEFVCQHSWPAGKFDMERWVFDLCDECCEWLLSVIKVQRP